MRSSVAALVNPASWEGECVLRGEAGEVGEKSHCQVVTLRGTVASVIGDCKGEIEGTYGRCRAGHF